jgi:hypothetical protein
LEGWHQLCSIGSTGGPLDGSPSREVRGSGCQRGILGKRLCTAHQRSEADGAKSSRAIQPGRRRPAHGFPTTTTLPHRTLFLAPPSSPPLHPSCDIAGSAAVHPQGPEPAFLDSSLPTFDDSPLCQCSCGPCSGQHHRVKPRRLTPAADRAIPSDYFAIPSATSATTTPTVAEFGASPSGDHFFPFAAARGVDAHCTTSCDPALLRQPCRRRQHLQGARLKGAH